MASSLKNLSEYDPDKIASAEKMRFGVVVSEWNASVTENLFSGAKSTLLNLGTIENDIVRRNVPGSFELVLGAQLMAETGRFDAIICLGAVIQGETRHFDFICDAVANGIAQLNLKLNIPVIFGVLTTGTQQQAIARSGGKHGNKGIEAAIAAIKMVALKKDLQG